VLPPPPSNLVEFLADVVGQVIGQWMGVLSVLAPFAIGWFRPFRPGLWLFALLFVVGESFVAWVMIESISPGFIAAMLNRPFWHWSENIVAWLVASFVPWLIASICRIWLKPATEDTQQGVP
jgi:hypothetical protein